jgi:hypothetical protein
LLSERRRRGEIAGCAGLEFSAPTARLVPTQSGSKILILGALGLLRGENVLWFGDSIRPRDSIF